MILKKAVTAAAVAGAIVASLSGCSTASTSNVSAGSAKGSSAAVPEKAVESATQTPLTFNAGELLGGNATPTLGDGDPGEVSVVSTGVLQKDEYSNSGVLAFAFRNNTDAAISHVDFTATAKADGTLVASGSSQNVVPAQVQPGEPGFGYIYLEDASSVPESGVEYAFRATTSPADTDAFNTAPLRVTEANHNGSSIIGSAVNETGEPLTGPYSVGVYCLDGDALTASTLDYATEDGDVESGGSVSFSHNLFETSCDSFVVGVSGWFK